MREQDIVALLARRYPPPVWAFLPQLRNGTGYAKAARTADAIAMALWPSRGLEIVGFEVKVSRADWLREMKDAEKAEEFFAVCDRWFVVAPEDAVRAEEVPRGWGWLAPKGQDLKTMVPAPDKGHDREPDRLFVAAILRRVQETFISRESIEAELKKAREGGRKLAAQDLKWSAEEFDRLKGTVTAFEKASGVKIEYGWRSGEHVGRAVRQVLEHGPEQIRGAMEAHANWLRRTLKECEEYLGREE